MSQPRREPSAAPSPSPSDEGPISRTQRNWWNDKPLIVERPRRGREGATAQQSVEMILVRQLAGYLFVPVLVVDTTGTVVFYNEPAERILGVRFEETGRIGPDDIDRLVELSGNPAAAPDDAGGRSDIAPHERRPAHPRRWLSLRRPPP